MEVLLDDSPRQSVFRKEGSSSAQANSEVLGYDGVAQRAFFNVVTVEHVQVRD